MTWIQQIFAFLRDAFLWWVTIAPWQQGVRVRCGKHVTLLKCGMHLRLPLLDEIFVQPTRLRAHYVEPQTVSTRDGKTVVLAGAIQYEVVDVLALYQTLHNAHDTISQMVHGLVAEFVRSIDAASILPEDVEGRVLEQINLARYGMSVSGFRITNFAFAKVYRLMNGEVGTYTGYEARIDTTRNTRQQQP